jgi:regulator of sigma E protease
LSSLFVFAALDEAAAYVLAFVGFSALIILHEFGHFTAAKAVGMRVERFALFFPPLIVKVRRGETEYGIGAIPLGGFVKITGMNPEEDLPPEVAPRAYYHQPVWKRVVVILAGPFMNLVIAFFILFGLSFGTAEPTPTVASTVKGSPAQGVLKPGDRILSVDGKKAGEGPDRLTAMQRQIATHRCPGKPRDGCLATTPAVLRVERAGRVLTIRVRPRYTDELKRTRIGFAFGSRPLHPDVVEAARTSGDLMWAVTKGTVEAVVRIFDRKQREQISGVVGSYEITRQAFTFDERRALALLAVISLSLAIINLFPFLPLDGGHVFWSLVEKARGRPVPYRVMEQASVVGFLLVIMLFFIGLSNDIGRLTGGGFEQR